MTPRQRLFRLAVAVVALTLASYAFAHESLPFTDFDAVAYGDQDAWDEHDPRDQELR